MANLESAYGTSTYAKQCNNFFGRGAFDSNPDNACEGRQFPQPEDGILAQGIFLSVNFLDQADWRYEGSYVGTLDGGLNAHYASDGEWGQKIGSLAYECDKYLGSWDNNYFKIVEIVGNVPVYTTSSMTTQVRAQGVYMCNADKTQCIDSDNPNSYVNYYIGKQTNMPVRVVVTGETSNAYEIQVETGVNLGASGFITWTYAETGDHPNYEGANHGAEGTSDENYVSSGYINFANDYSNMSANQFWIPKTYNGSATTKTVANNPIKDTQRTTEFLPCSIKTSETVSGNIKTITSKAVDGSQFCTQKYDVATGKILKSTNDYYISGNQYSSMSIDYYSNGKYKIKNYIEYDIGTTNKIYESTTYYNSDGTYDYAYYYDYYSSGELKKRTYKDFTNNKNTYKSEYNYTAIGVLDWYTGYYYDSSGNLVRKENKDYDPNSGVLEFTSDYHYSGNEINYIYSYYYYENGEKKTQIYQDYANDNVIFRSDYNYRSNGVLDWYTAYYYDSNGKINRKENKDYNYSTGKLEYSSDYHYKDGVSDFTYSYYYYENGKKKTQIYQDYNQSGQLIYRSDYNFTSTGIYDWYVSYNYHSNGKISKKTIFDYNSDGQIYYEATYTYNSSGQQIDYYYNYR